MQTRPSDSELVRAAQAGDVAGMGILLERHRAGMQAVALSILEYGPEAQDAVQEAMLIALQRIDQLRDPGAVGPWLRAIVRNACRMCLRAGRADRTSLGAMPGLPSEVLSPEDHWERHALRDWIWHALESLSEPLQVVVLLRYFSGISSYDQIAALCGIPVGTVRSRLHQARRMLSTALLEAASSAHDDAAAIANRRRHDVIELFLAAERGDFEAALVATSTTDMALVWPSGHQDQGRLPLVRAMESDRTAGVRQLPVRVTASARITIIEADLVNPPWDPRHCPPGVTWLMSLRDDRIEHIRLFHPRRSVPLTQ